MEWTDNKYLRSVSYTTPQAGSRYASKRRTWKHSESRRIASIFLYNPFGPRDHNKEVCVGLGAASNLVSSVVENDERTTTH